MSVREDSPSEYPGLTQRDVAEAESHAERRPMIQRGCAACGALIASFTRYPDLPPPPGLPDLICRDCGGTIARWDDAGAAT